MPDVELLIRGARLVDGRSEQGVRDLAVGGGSILAIEPEIAAPQGATVLNADGLVVLPGIVDSHVHMTDLAGTSPSRSPAHERLVRAGVTTAVEFFDLQAVLEHWHASSVGLNILGLQALPAYPSHTRKTRIRDDIASALRAGCVGIKLLGGHFPNTPEVSALAIAEAAAAGCYLGFHAGTTPMAAIWTA